MYVTDKMRVSNYTSIFQIRLDGISVEGVQDVRITGMIKTVKQ